MATLQIACLLKVSGMSSAKWMWRINAVGTGMRCLKTSPPARRQETRKSDGTLMDGTVRVFGHSAVPPVQAFHFQGIFLFEGKSKEFWTLQRIFHGIQTF